MGTEKAGSLALSSKVAVVLVQYNLNWARRSSMIHGPPCRCLECSLCMSALTWARAVLVLLLATNKQDNVLGCLKASSTDFPIHNNIETVKVTLYIRVYNSFTDAEMSCPSYIWRWSISSFPYPLSHGMLCVPHPLSYHVGNAFFCMLLSMAYLALISSSRFHMHR